MSSTTEEFRNDAELRTDGALINSLTGLGTTKDKQVYTRVSGRWQTLSQSEAEVLYTYGLPRRIIDSVANECTKHLTTVKLGDEVEVNEIDWLPQFDEFLKVTEFHQRLSEVVKLQRLYGGAGLVLLIDDGRLPEEPVDENNIRAVNDYIPLSRYELIPEDFTITDYSRPEFYRITTSQRLTEDQESSYVNLRVHHTRVARFDGLYLPWNLRARNNGWGQGVLSSIWDAMKKYWTALDGLVEIAQDSSVFTHKIPGLFQRVAAGNEADLRKRLEANALSRSVYGGMVIDTEEEVDFLNRSLSGLQGSLDPFIKEIQASLGWPASILMGDSPGGLGKEGRFEERAWASIIESWQANYMRTAVTQVMKYCLLNKSGPTGGVEPKNWSVFFPSVFTETDTEKADLRLKMAQVDAQYIQLGVVSPVEVRESRWGETEYSIETTLNEAVSNQLALSADAQFEAQMTGYAAQQEAYTSNGVEEGQGGTAEPQGATTAGGNAGTQQNQATSQPQNTNKTDGFESYDAQNLRIKITNSTTDGIRVGYPVAADGQRIDSSGAGPVLVLGPHRSKAYKVYRARYDTEEGIVDGPYVTAFASLRAARTAVKRLWPSQNVVGLSPISGAELETLQIGWGAY